MEMHFWFLTDSAATFTKGTELYCSPHYPYKEIRTHYTQRLHWLPVHLRPTYKVLLFTYALNGLAPDYLAELISYCPVNRTLQSASLPALLFVPASLTVTHGDRRFAVRSAVLWNNLTPSLRTAKSLQVFKTLLKTHLFKQAFL